MRKIIYLLFSLSSFPSCLSIFDKPFDQDNQLYSLYRQRIEKSNFVLYEFAFSGSFVTSTDYIGTTVMDSSKIFSRGKIRALPSPYFKSKPTGDRIELIDIEHIFTSEADTALTPKRIYKLYMDKVELEITEYNNTYGSASINTGLMQYEFDDFDETNDSLMLANVTKKFGGTEFTENITFTKGNIKAVENDNNELLYFQIRQPIIMRGSIYKPTDPFKLVDNQPIVGIATYEFYPRRKISAKDISDIGIWKRVK